MWSSSSAHSSNVTSVAFSPDGDAFASASLDNTLRLWATNGTLLRTFTGHEVGVTAVAFSPDSAKLASGSADGSIKVWNRADGICSATISAHGSAVTSLDFTPDSSRVLSGGEDAFVRLWSAADGTLLQTLGGQSELCRCRCRFARWDTVCQRGWRGRHCCSPLGRWVALRDARWSYRFCERPRFRPGQRHTRLWRRPARSHHQTLAVERRCTGPNHHSRNQWCDGFSLFRPMANSWLRAQIAPSRTFPSGMLRTVTSFGQCPATQMV